MNPGRTGGQLVVAQLRELGVDMVFCVPGESYLAVLDALVDAPEIRVITCRQEGGAAVMAEAYGKLTGRPGVCLVTRGPGASNAAIGLHTARQDSTPMVMLIGQVSRADRDREAFQEMDYRSLLAELTKWTAQVDQADRIPEYLARAFRTAVVGRPGPVALALPEDVLTETADVDVVPAHRHDGPAPRADQLTEVTELLGAAERPLMVVGGGRWTTETGRTVIAFAEANDLPVAVAFRCQDYVDNRSSVYAGHLGLGISQDLAQRVRRADLILALGTRLDDCTTNGYRLLTPPVPRQRLVHVHPGPDELGSVYAAELQIVSDPGEFAAALTGVRLPDSDGRAAWTAELRAGYLRFGEPIDQPGPLNLGRALSELRAAVPSDVIVTSGAGNYTLWAHRFWTFGAHGTQLAPRSGAMGYSVPAAVAAKLIRPDLPVLSLSGDGCFLMNGQELATAVAHRLTIVFVVVNNGVLGTIRMHQERNYPGRVIATDLVNPDFVALAIAYGARGVLVTSTAEFMPAVLAGFAADGPTVVEVRLDPRVVTPATPAASE